MARRRRRRNQRSRNRSVPTDNSSTGTIREDRALRSKLQEASKNVPRYLFRMWHPGSGGNRRLNLTERVIPHAFFKGIGHRSVYDMEVYEFIDNTDRHLKGNCKVVSEFSSWAASPMFVFNYATQYRKTAYIAVVDTQELQDGDENAMFYVPDLQDIFGYRKGCGPAYDQYDWEYFVHGVVEGEHYSAVSFWTLGEYGLIDHFPRLKKDVDAWDETERLSLPGPIVHFYHDELADLFNIAKLFEWVDLSVFVMVALFCYKKRNIPNNGLSEGTLSQFIHVLRGEKEAIRSWGDSRYLYLDRYDATHYEDIRQIVKVMKSLHDYCCPPRPEDQPASAGSHHLDPSAAVAPSLVPYWRDFLTPRYGAHGLHGCVHAVPTSGASYDGVYDSNVFKRLPNISNSSHRPADVKLSKGEQITLTSHLGFLVINSNDKVPLNEATVLPAEIQFQRLLENSRSLWFAYISRGTSVTVNGVKYFGLHETILGPLPPKTKWEYEGNIAVLYVDDPNAPFLDLGAWAKNSLTQLAQQFAQARLC